MKLKENQKITINCIGNRFLTVLPGNTIKFSKGAIEIDNGEALFFANKIQIIDINVTGFDDEDRKIIEIKIAKLFS